MRPAPVPWNGDPSTYLVRAASTIARYEPRVRAFTHLDHRALDPVAAPSGGPLGGMPVVVKEIFDVAGMPVTFGTRVHGGRVPDKDAVVVERLRRAGASVMGMTTTTPLACGTTTVTDNPVVPGHTPGGSSAGSGAAVGAGFAPVALASQSQASTLRPASYCGVWGLKPTHGRLPRQGMLLLSDTLDDVGLIAASWADLVRVFLVLDPWPPTTAKPVGITPSAPTRIGVLGLDHGGVSSPGTRAAFDDLVSRLATVAHVLQHTPELEMVDRMVAGSGEDCFTLFCCESADLLATHLAVGETDPRFTEMLGRARSAGPRGRRDALAVRSRLRETWSALSGHVDLVISLSTTNPAPPGHRSTGCRRLPATASLLGIPSVSAPWLSVDGRPLGVQLLGFEDGDERLLAHAGWLDRLVQSAVVPADGRRTTPGPSPQEIAP